MRCLLGKPLSFSKKGLRPNAAEKLQLAVKDGLGKTFQASRTFDCTAAGELNIDKNQFRDFIACAKSDSDSAFMLPEFESYTIKLESKNISQDILVHS